MIRLLIAAHSAVVRAGLESLVVSDPRIHIVGVHADLSALPDLRPDVVLAALPESELAPAPAIVLLTADPTSGYSRENLALGVRAILPESATPAEILAAVDAAAAGLAVVDPAELEPLLPPARRTSSTAEQQSLTPRELEVLRLMAEGAPNKTIAWKLGVSEHTVKFHVGAVMAKLDAGSRTEAVANAIRRGLVPI